MDQALVARYWCHVCSQMVSPVMEVEIKCPYCDSGFVEEMEGRGEDAETPIADLGSDRALSLWAPLLLGMMGGTPRRRRFRRGIREEEEEDSSDLDHDFVSLLRRRRRSYAILQLLHGLQEGIRLESDPHEREREGGREREREGVILINPVNQALVLQGSVDSNQIQNQSSDTAGIGALLGDYFVGPGLELLLQHLAENDPNRCGTPPAQKEAVEKMPTVKIEEKMSCSVCLEDFVIREVAREMPCKHKFHGGCIIPWLEIHSSCPVCRFQMPVVEESEDSNGGGNGSREEGSGGDGGSGGNGRRFWVPVPWPFNGLFSLSGSPSSGNSSSEPPSSSSSNS